MALVSRSFGLRISTAEFFCASSVFKVTSLGLLVKRGYRKFVDRVFASPGKDRWAIWDGLVVEEFWLAEFRWANSGFNFGTIISGLCFFNSWDDGFLLWSGLVG